MKNSYIFLSDCVEEIEALAVIDILRRAGVPIVTISMNDSLEIASSHGVTIKADKLFSEVDFSDAEYLIMPGGSTKLNDYEELKSLLLEHNKRGGKIAAICAAPMVLGGLGLLDGKQATCYPGFEECLSGATFIDQSVVVDGTITTANGPASSLKFAYELVRQMCGEEMVATLQKQMMYN